MSFAGIHVYVFLPNLIAKFFTPLHTKCILYLLYHSMKQIVLMLILAYKCYYSHFVLKQKDKSFKNHKVASLRLLKYFACIHESLQNLFS